MGAKAVAEALRGSAFLADVGQRDRNPARIAFTVVGGLLAGFAAALAVFILVLVAYLAVTGQIGLGAAGVSKAATSLTSPDTADLKNVLLLLVTPAATNGPLALAFIAVAAAASHRRMRAYLSAILKLRWRLLATGFVLSAMVMAPLFLIEIWRSGEPPALPLLTVSRDPAGRAAYVLAVVVLLIPAAAAEELVFRGWLLKQTAAFTRNVTALLVINGVVFSAIHGDFSPDAFLTRAVMGAGFAYMTLRLAGIEFATGAHAANNILIVLFIEPLTLKTTVAPGMTAGSTLEDLALAIAYVAITEAVVRWAPLRRLAGVDGAPTSGASRASAAAP